MLSMMPSLVAFRPKPDDVSRRHDMPLIGCQRFQETARGTLKYRAAFIANDADQPLHAQDATQAASFAVDSQLHVHAGIVFNELGTGDRAFPRDGALTTDALAARGISASIVLGKSLIASPHFPVLTKVCPNLASF